MVVVEEQEYCYSDSDDSDDEDVDRYVFLARQPTPASRHPVPEDDRDASSANDEDDGAAGKEGSESEGGSVVGKRKKTPPPRKKPRLLELIIAPPLAAQTPPPSGSESNFASSSAGESGSEGSHPHEKAHEHRAPREAKTKKRGACGKRSRTPGGEAEGDRDDVAAAAAAAAKTGALSSGAASGRFSCSLCDRCFDSYQALGGHVLGHRKRTKIAAIIAAAAILDADDAAGAVEVAEEGAKSIAGQDEKKDSSVAARRGKTNGEGSSSDEGKTVDDAAASGDQDADRAQGHKRQRKVHGKGSKGGVREPVFAGIHDDDAANGNDGFGNKCKPTGVSGHGFFTDGNSRRKMDIGTASLNRKVVVVAGTCHEGSANGNGGDVCRTRYKCKVCGTECLTGRALGGHMRKHRKRPPVVVGGGGEDRSPGPATDDDDCQIPLAQLFGAETSFLQRGV